MRLGFLGDTEYWFSRLGDIYKPETSIPWYKESFVEKPYYEKYWAQSERAKQVKKAIEDSKLGYLAGVNSFVPKAMRSRFSGYRAESHL